MSDDVGLQRLEAVEGNGRIGRRIGARALDQNLVADRQRDRQGIHVLLVHHVGRIAGRTGEHAGLHLVSVMRGADRVADRLVHGFGETAELSALTSAGPTGLRRGNRSTDAAPIFLAQNDPLVLMLGVADGGAEGILDIGLR